MRRIKLCVVALLIASVGSLARAAEPTEAVDGLELAIQARLAALEETPGNRATRAEGKRLAAAATPLAAIGGTDLKADARLYIAAAKQLRRAKSSDPAVIGAAVTVANDLVDRLNTLLVTETDRLVSLVDVRARLAARVALAKGRQRLEAATELVGTDLTRALKLLGTAADVLGTVLDAAEGAPVLAGPPAGMTIFRQPGSRGTVHLWNTSSAEGETTFEVLSVRYEVTVLTFGAPSFELYVGLEKLLSRANISAPMSTIAPNELYDLFAEQLVARARQLSEASGQSFLGTNGSLVIELADHPTFRIPFSGR